MARLPHPERPVPRKIGPAIVIVCLKLCLAFSLTQHDCCHARELQPRHTQAATRAAATASLSLRHLVRNQRHGYVSGQSCPKFWQHGLGAQQRPIPPSSVGPLQTGFAQLLTHCQPSKATDIRGSSNSHLSHHTTLRHRRISTVRPRQHRHTSLRRTSPRSRANGGPFTIASTSAGIMPTRVRAKHSGRLPDTMRRRTRAATLGATTRHSSSSTNTARRLGRLLVRRRAAEAAWAWAVAWRWAPSPV